jgi:predicted PP-loop superfamily ATPase
MSRVEENATLDTGIVRAVWMNLDELQESARARSPLVTKVIQDALLVKNILYRSFMSTTLLLSLQIWMLNPMQQRVIVGMSGGVDSSVSAALYFNKDIKLKVFS